MGLPVESSRLAVRGVELDRTEAVRRVRPAKIAEVHAPARQRWLDADDAQRDGVVGGYRDAERRRCRSCECTSLQRS